MQEENDWITAEISPTSTNAMYRGMKKRSIEYTKFFNDFYYLLPQQLPSEKMREVIDGGKDLQMEIVFELQTARRRDLDNCLKSCLDTIAKKYGFDDRRIYKIISEKKIADKDRISFSISEYKSNPRAGNDGKNPLDQINLTKNYSSYTGGDE